MVLIDTSIWVSHFKDRSQQLETLLMKGKVVCHPFIIGELACGNLKNRKEILSLLEALPPATTADYKEVLYFIEQHQLMGIGLGYIDVHLLASARLSRILFWTRDKKLREAAVKLNSSYK
jgi:predicted nucleic acid-binding protein